MDAITNVVGEAREEVALVLAVQPFPQAIPRGGHVLLGQLVDDVVEVVRVAARLRTSGEDNVHLGQQQKHIKYQQYRETSAYR